MGTFLAVFLPLLAFVLLAARVADQHGQRPHVEAPPRPKGRHRA